MLNRQKGYEESDSSSLCSTCSSSSSEADDAYQLPQRRSYGGVRVNYVPNDALALARHNQLMQQRKLAQQSNNSNQSTSSEKDSKNCIIS